LSGRATFSSPRHNAFVADRNGSPTKRAAQSKRPDDRVIVGPSEFFEL
jgi:hypothetical protein